MFEDIMLFSVSCLRWTIFFLAYADQDVTHFFICTTTLCQALH